MSVSLTISNTFESKKDDFFYWKLLVRIDPLLQDKIQKVIQKSTYSGRSTLLVQSESDKCLFESPKIQKAMKSFWLAVTCYLKEDANCRFSGGKSIEVLHELQFVDFRPHTTHHEIVVYQNEQGSSSSTRSLAVAIPKWVRLSSVGSQRTTTTDQASSGVSESIQSTAPIPPSMWCISYNQLMAVDMQASKKFGTREYPNKTMRDICLQIIERKCSETGKSYALSLNPHGLPIDVFVSHAWDGNFSSFVHSIRRAFDGSTRKPNLWICAFALVQERNGGSGDIIAQQIGSSDMPLEDSPFVQALRAAHMYCVVRNSNNDVYGRIWCVCELIYAKHFGLVPGKTQVAGPNVFAHKQSSVLDAQATNLKDRDRILRVLLTEFDREEIDTIVHDLRTQNAPREQVQSWMF